MTSEVALYTSLNVILITAVYPIAGNNSNTTSTIDPCGICDNGGTCDPSIPQCICPIDFTGENCEEVKFNCNMQSCLNGGYCNKNTGVCACVDPYYGERCQSSNDPWNSPTEDEKNRRSMIVSIIFSLVVMMAVCMVVIYINVKRIRDRQEDEEAEEEVRNAIQVDGPPRLRLPEGLRMKQVGYDIQRNDSSCFGNQSGSWFPSLPKRKRSSKAGLRGISTSPGALQNSSKRALDREICERTPSGVTLQECSLVSLPPPYDEAAASDEKETSVHTDVSGLFMRCPSTISSEGQNGSECPSPTGNVGESEMAMKNLHSSRIDVELGSDSNGFFDSGKTSSQGGDVESSRDQHDPSGSDSNAVDSTTL